MKTDILLIGGGVASAAAAAELRERGFDGSILLVTRELEPPYHRPPITKDLLAGRCARDALAIHGDEWWTERDVELRTRSAVMVLDVGERRATLASKEQISYGQALVATGAMVRRLKVDGAALAGIHYLRAPGNAETLRAEAADAEKVVVVGGSFIACEVAASLTAQGRSCTLVMQEQLPMERAFGPTVGRYVADLLAAHGVGVMPGEDVVAFAGDERVEAVVTASGRRLEADLVVVGAGALPDAMLARRAGLELGESGGIRCDARLRTSADGVYAAGDVCEYDSPLHGRRVRIEHEEHAIAQGRTVARNLLGEEVEHDVVPYFWTELADWAMLEYVGLAGRWDTERVAGDPAEGRFTLWCVDGGRVVGAVAVGRPGDVDVARDLVATRAPAARLEQLGAGAA